MSSKDSKGSSDSLPTKTKKKDKTKKESKKEEKEKSKKEKKEKSKNRDSKDLDNHAANDVNAKIEVGGQEDSPSPKTKTKFGIFRLSGRKSKGDKRNSKHGSSDSLKRRSGDSADFESLGSELSLEGSTASAEESTTITEMSTTSAKVPTTITEVPTSAEVSRTITEMSTTSAEVPTTITEVPPSVEVSTTIAEVSRTSAEVSTTVAEVAEETNEITKPQSNKEVSNKTAGGEALMVEKSSEVKIISAVNPDLEENKEIEKLGTNQAVVDDSSPNQDSVNEKMKKETLTVESVSFQEQTPEASEEQTFEFKLQSSVTSSKANKNVEGKEEQHNRTEGNKTESVELATEENASTHENEKDEVVAPASEQKYEVSLEDIKPEQGRDITSSEDESVDTVISTEALNTRVVGETSEDSEIKIQSKNDVEELIISTYHERKSPMQDANKEPPPLDKDAIVLTYENKVQEETREEQHVQEEPMTLASKERREDLLLSEITFQEEPVTETEPVLLEKNEKTMKEDNIHGEAPTEETSEEELLIPTYVQRKRDNTEEEQDEQEAPVNEEAMVLSYPEKEEDQIQNENQDGPEANEEEPMVLAFNDQKENQIQEQIEEFLKLDANTEEKSTKESETVKKDEEVEKTPSRDKRAEDKLPETKEISDERSEKFTHESSLFDKKSTFITSTPKREPIDSGQGTRRDVENEEHEATRPVNYNVTSSKETSVEFHLKVQMVNNIKDAKMSTKVLLAHLAEINKKLRMLQKELLEIQKYNGNNNQALATARVAVET